MKQITHHLITLIRDHLKIVSDDDFYFGTFAGNDKKPFTGTLCGTVACAIGHATAIPEFQKRGLSLISSSIIPRGQIRLTLENGVSLFDSDAITSVLEMEPEDLFIIPMGMTTIPVPRTRAIWHLFMPHTSLDENASRESVIARIDQFLELNPASQ